MLEPTMRLAWLTDLHLNFVDVDCVDALCRRVRDEGADAVLISGDIAEGPSIEPYLEYLDRWLDRPIFFVLGDHDFTGEASRRFDSGSPSSSRDCRDFTG